MINKKLLLLCVGLLMTTQMIFSQVPSYVPTNGLVGYWPFNGNANDQSGNSNNGTPNGATLTTDRFGIANQAYYFDGNNQNIVCSNTINSVQSITVSSWVLVNSLEGGALIIQNNPTNCTNVNFTSNFGYLQKMAFSHNAINCNQPGTNLSTEASTPISNYTGTWCHVVSVIDNIGTTKLYMNGILIDSTVSNLGYNFCTSLNSTLRFGGPWWNNDGQWLKGKLDDIGIWNRELTQDEITSLYYSENTCQSLVINTGVLSFNPPTYNNTITIYPNPANDHITIDCGNLSNVSGWTIKIVNTLGQEVFSGAMNTQQYVVPLNTWSGQGVYFVKVYDGSNNLLNTKKIILQ